jgi:hypothetical protein
MGDRWTFLARQPLMSSASASRVALRDVTYAIYPLATAAGVLSNAGFVEARIPAPLVS